jgi:hypothetical protein
MTCVSIYSFCFCPMMTNIGEGTVNMDEFIRAVERGEDTKTAEEKVLSLTLSIYLYLYSLFVCCATASFQHCM